MREKDATSVVRLEFGAILDFGSFLSGPARAASLIELERHQARWNLLTNFVVLAAGIGLAGVFALWLDSPGWGTPHDIVVALLAGLGTRLVVGVAARQS